jgi:hypothetical protein
MYALSSLLEILFGGKGILFEDKLNKKIDSKIHSGERERV